MSATNVPGVAYGPPPSLGTPGITLPPAACGVKYFSSNISERTGGAGATHSRVTTHSRSREG
ncbi:hypothetical protein E2C01_020126 [Portunus trituberculatus]|uniref:Uncharacterized protein n=1 Tax=Portunus trituberculatus TaxID=210409 RepID=A0A5B7E2B3_PORTR|nr:hypothetical protein [Portunus trituberculatus]